MKRPMATIGFSMIASFLILTNIAHRTTVALVVGATVLLLLFLIFKKFRKQTSIIFCLIGFLVFSCSFITAEKNYVSELSEIQEKTVINGVVCSEPVNSDYAFSYIIRPENKNYKIRFVSQEDLYIRAGDYVFVAAENYEIQEDTELFESALGSKIYFTVFASDGNTMEKTGRSNFFYRNIGAVKRGFTKIVDSYLPGENGAIAKAMTIGDKSELDDETVQLFNYCGTSHLLVISGLHLSVWSLGIIRLLDKSHRTRKFSVYAGLLCLAVYSALTGFTVSVIRAGFMVGTVLAARLFDRDADSINSIGLSLVVILLQNPFAPFSASLWLTVLSTLGILFFFEKLYLWLNRKIMSRAKGFVSFTSAFTQTTAISLSTAIFTFPVFVLNFGMLPTASVISNFLMVEASMLLMILTMAGVFAHITFLYPISYACFFLVGAIGSYLRFCAEKIGMWEGSVITLNHRYYRYFMCFLLIAVGFISVMRKLRKNIVKPAAAVLSVLFIAVSVYCNVHENRTPCVDVIFTKEEPVIMVCSNEKSLLVGLTEHTADYSVREMMNRHNEKTIDAVFVSGKSGNSFSKAARIRRKFGAGEFYFYNDVLPGFENVSYGNCRGVNVSLDTQVLFDEELQSYNVVFKDKTVLVIDCEKTEKLFQKDKMYDIIILYGDKSSYYINTAEKFLENNGKIYTQSDNKNVMIYAERQVTENGVDL